MALLAAYAVPHPPLIVPAVGRGQETAIADTIAAYREVARRVAAHRPDLIVITSPHAPLYRDGFFIADTPEETGSLAAFGQPDERVTTRTDLPFAKDVAARLHRRGIPSAGAPASMADSTTPPSYRSISWKRPSTWARWPWCAWGSQDSPRPTTASWAGPLPRPRAP